MENFQSLQRLVELIIKHGLPKEQTIFEEISEYNKTNNWLKNTGGNGIESVPSAGSNPELQCMRITYAGITLNVVCY